MNPPARTDLHAGFGGDALDQMERHRTKCRAEDPTRRHGNRRTQGDAVDARCGTLRNHRSQRAHIAERELYGQRHVAACSEPWQERAEVDVDIGHGKLEAGNPFDLIELADTLEHVDIVAAE